MVGNLRLFRKLALIVAAVALIFLFIFTYLWMVALAKEFYLYGTLAVACSAIFSASLFFAAAASLLIAYRLDAEEFEKSREPVPEDPVVATYKTLSKSKKWLLRNAMRANAEGESLLLENGGIMSENASDLVSLGILGVIGTREEGGSVMTAYTVIGPWRAYLKKKMSDLEAVTDEEARADLR